MKLTGKTKAAFDYWLRNRMTIRIVDDLYLNALIIEFFDSVGIYISMPYLDNLFSSFTNNDWNGDFETRTEATNAAIEKANIIYNEYKL